MMSMKISKWYEVSPSLRVQLDKRVIRVEIIDGYKRLMAHAWFPFEGLKLQYVLGKWFLEGIKEKKDFLSKKIEITLDRLRDIRKDIERVKSSARPDKDRLECLERDKRSYQEELDRLKARYTAYDVLEERLERLLENIDTIARLEGWNE